MFVYGFFVNINAVIFGFKNFVSVKMFVNPANRVIYRTIEHVLVLYVQELFSLPKP